MRRLFAIFALALIMCAVALNGQTIQCNSGKAYKFRLTKEQMAECLRKERVRQEWLRDLVMTIPLDSFRRNVDLQADTNEGQWVWVNQSGGDIRFTVINNPPFRVEMSNDILTGRGKGKERFVVRLSDNDPNARVRLLRHVKSRGARQLKWSESDSGYVCTITYDGQSVLEVEKDGYLVRAKIGPMRWFSNLDYRWHGNEKWRSVASSWGVSDKNMYKPGETVKWKFLLVDRKGRPCRGEVEVMLDSRRVMTGKLDKYGAIAGETMLTDSMELRSGEVFRMRAVAKGGEGSFLARYEDYELKALNVRAKTEKDVVTHGDTVRLLLTVTDERDKEVMDAKAWGMWRITGIHAIQDDVVLFPDNDVRLDTVSVVNGRAVLQIPTSKLPMGDLFIDIDWWVRSAEGEERNGMVSTECLMTMDGREDYSDYAVRSEIKIESVNVADSVGFRCDGEGKMFGWVIYKDGKVLESGRDTALDWKVSEKGMAQYICVVHGEGRRGVSYVNHSADRLKVVVVQKTRVKPGGEDDIELRVTDSRGKPVEGVDITAIAGTSKLRNNIKEPTLYEKKGFHCSGHPQAISYGFQFDAEEKLSDSTLAQLVEAVGTQYWRLVKGDKVVEVSCPSSVGSQIVPVLTRGGKIVDVAMTIINGNTFLPNTCNRYAVRPVRGRNHIQFFTADSCFQATVDVNDTLHKKRWIGIPASKCVASSVDPQWVKKSCVQLYSIVTDYEGRGEAYLRNGGVIVPLENCRGIAVSGMGAVKVGAVSLDTALAREDVALGNRSVQLWQDPTVIQYTLGCDTPMVGQFSLNDSVCTIDELRQRWMERLDDEMSLPSYGVQTVKYSTVYVNLIPGDDEQQKITCYRQNGDTLWKVANGYEQALCVASCQDYELVFVYEGWKTRRMVINANKGERVYLRSGCRACEGVVDTLLRNEMRRQTERFLAEHEQRYESQSGLYYGSVKGVRVRGVGGVYAPRPMAMKSVALTNEVAGIEEELVDMNESSDDMAFYDTGEEEEMEEEEMVLAYGTSSGKDNEVEMRNVFSDVAFFVTDCHTDKNGRAVMRVKYPDDLTEWSECFVAIKGRQRGVTRSSVRVEKDHEAKLNLPRFAVLGDTVGAVGIGVDRVTGEHRSDTLMSVAEGDSLCMSYVYKTDGEKRCVKIYPQGLQMIEGGYWMMDSDAMVRLEYKPEYGEMKVGLFGDAREMMMQSVRRVAEQDWCESNDFMANRLRALRMLPKSDSTERVMRQIEKKLRKNRGKDGMWSWWGSAGGSLRVTQRVLEAIGASENEAPLLMELALLRERNRGKWYVLMQIAQLYRLVGQAETARMIASEIPDDSIRSVSLRIDKQMIEGREVKFDTMRHETYTGGSYYSYRSGNAPWCCVICDEVQTTLQAYRYFMSIADKAECRRIKHWLLQYGFRGFASERVEMEIVSALWEGQPIAMEDVLWQMSVGGKAIEKLPYRTTVRSAVDVEYKGRRDIYVSTEQNWWNKNPEIQGNGMSVCTAYDKGVITVTVSVEHTAENVIISVPVPAGCSYADEQPWSNSETFREEYRDRVNLYCYRLREGKHIFKVRLNERYPGVYTLNPAQIRLVDYPVFNANEAVKKVVVR